MGLTLSTNIYGYNLFSILVYNCPHSGIFLASVS